MSYPSIMIAVETRTDHATALGYFRNACISVRACSSMVACFARMSSFALISSPSKFEVMVSR